MRVWLLHNTSLRTDKIRRLVERLAQEAHARGHEVRILQNDSLFAGVDSAGASWLEPALPEEQPPAERPEAVFFWDKDVLLARLLEQRGLRLLNPAAAIEACDNKSLMHLRLADRGIPMPQTLFGAFTYYTAELSEALAKRAFSVLGTPLVLKEAFGSFGMQVYLIESPAALMEKVSALGGRPYLLQRFVASSRGRDLRVNLIGDRVVGAMERRSETDFRANMTLGAGGTPVRLTPAQEAVALAAHRALGLDFSGVDLLYGTQGEPILCEVNSNVNFLSFETASGVNFAGLLLDYAEKKVRS